MNRRTVIYIATDNKSSAELIKESISDEFSDVVFSTSFASVAEGFDQSGASIILLAYNSVTQSDEVYDDFLLHSKQIHLLPCRVLLLCGKNEASVAYKLCHAKKYDNYIVFWPLHYDPFRLMISITQAVTELEELYNMRGKLAELADKERINTELEALVIKQAEGAIRYATGINDNASKIKVSVEEALDNIDRQTREGVSVDQYNKGLELSAKIKDAFNLEKVRKKIEEIKALSRDFDAFFFGHINLSKRIGDQAKTLKKNILVVDDDAFQRNVLVSLLKAENYDVEVASSGAEAIKVLHDNTPDVILMDILMPGISGIETTKYIKSNAWSKDIPVIIISGQSQKDIIVDCIKMGADSFVLKPFDRQTIIKKISTALNNK